MMTSLDHIRRHSDGSVDTEYYVAIGNRERARVLVALFARLFGSFRFPRRRAAPQPRPRAGRWEINRSMEEI